MHDLPKMAPDQIVPAAADHGAEIVVNTQETAVQITLGKADDGLVEE